MLEFLPITKFKQLFQLMFSIFISEALKLFNVSGATITVIVLSIFFPIAVFYCYLIM